MAGIQFKMFQRPSPNLKFEKNLPKILKPKFLKSIPVSQVLAHWHIDHVCQVSWQSEKTVRGVAI